MRNCFRKGTIGETWKQEELDRWFDPAFQNFVNRELVAGMRLTLNILKRLNDFEYVLEVMGDYTDTDASLGPMHNIGDAHIARGAHKFE